MDMKLQVALDRLEWSECLRLIEQLQDTVDLVEIGTGVIKEYGMAIVREVREAFPVLPLVADMKICDAGRYEAEQALLAGADAVTVMGFAPLSTIRDVHAVAGRLGKQAIVDLLGITDRSRVNQLAEAGCSHFCLHVGLDDQSAGHQADQRLFELVQPLAHVKISVAGGINEQTIDRFLLQSVHTVIVGSAITGSKLPKQAAEQIRSKCQSPSESG
ncbi:Fe-S cluster assembly protein HesB [Brevibacillus centrosporus]|nr:Fe-S cluster assembly protein HesB [Brevibacillus centrosporus]